MYDVHIKRTGPDGKVKGIETVCESSVFNTLDYGLTTYHEILDVTVFPRRVPRYIDSSGVRYY